MLALLLVLAVEGVNGPQRASATPQLRGVGVHSLWGDNSEAEIDRDLDLVRAAGSSAVRVDVAWASLEPRAKGQISGWYQHRLDRLIAGASGRGMGVIVTLWATPCWASSAPAHVKRGCQVEWDGTVVAYPPVRNEDYGDVARWMTQRYGTRLAALEVWNEPNLHYDMFWRAPEPAAAYAALVRAAYPAAKAGDARVPVLAGALAKPDIPFLQSLYAHGIRGFYDGISMHPYGIELTRAKLDGFHGAQQRAGDATGIWITEFGSPTGDYPGWRVSKPEQATYIRIAPPTSPPTSPTRA